MDAPFITTGTPRSGTSLVMQILVALGVYARNLTGADISNPEGYYEDREFLDYITPMAQKLRVLAERFPSSHLNAFLCCKRIEVESWLKIKGYPDAGPWGIKNPDILQDWQFMDLLFPDAKWILTQRDRNESIQSLRSFMNEGRGIPIHPLEAAFNKSYCTDIVDQHLSAMDDFKGHISMYDEIAVINCARSGDLASIEALVKKHGLIWNEDVVRGVIKKNLVHYTADNNGVVARRDDYPFDHS